MSGKRSSRGQRSWEDEEGEKLIPEPIWQRATHRPLAGLVRLLTGELLVYV